MKNLQKRSVVVENGHPKLPTSSQIEYGEIAVNYAAGYETLSIRNTEDGIATFSSDSLIDSKIESRISGITMNGTALTVSGGVVDLGVVLTEEEELVISAALNDLNDRVAELSADTLNKQDTLISGTNIKTINGQSLLGSGDMVISASSESSGITSITINGNVFTGDSVNLGDYITQEKEYVISSALNNLNSRVIDLNASVTGKQDTLISGTNIKTINNQSILGNGNITIEGGGATYTAGTGINIANNIISVTGKQDTLISGTNIKTINNQSILGSGNITIEGGGGGTEYSAGTNIDITNHVISVTGLSSYELTSNKATTITSASTHTEYASAKAVYDIVGDIDVALNAILTGTTS